MDVLTMLKFWKTTSNVAAATTTTITTTSTNGDATHSTLSDHFTEESDDDNDDDSYFELELTLPPQNSKTQENQQIKSKIGWDSRPKPQSPISVIRTASPKLPVFMFGRLAAKKSSKRNNNRFEDFSETDSVSERCYFSPRRISNDSNSSFTVRFKIEDGSIVPKFTRSRSSSSSSTSTVFTSPKIESRNSVDEFPETSKRFSRYLNLMIPKSMKKNTNGERFGGCSPARSTATPFSPVKEKQSRFLVKCKRLAKSKSASAVVGVSSPSNFPARNDLPADGIEGAILHCKRSLKGNTPSNSSLSRCSSDPSHEKLIQVSEQI